MDVSVIMEGYPIKPVSVVTLEGYLSQNYKITDESGDIFIFKYYQNSREFRRIKAENDLMHFLSTQMPIDISRPAHPKMIQYPDGSFSRMLTYLPGDFLKDVNYSAELAFNFGEIIAQLHGSLTNYRDTEIEAYDHKWNLLNCLDSLNDVHYILDPTRRKIVSYFLDQYELFSQEILRTLPKQVLHNDLNDWNVLVADNKIRGIIDFGDICYAPKVCDLAIALAYLLLDKENPIDVTQSLAKGYATMQRLSEKEIKLLYNLIAVRLCISVISSSKARSTTSSSDYVFVTEKQAWDLLDKWLTINPIRFENCLRPTFSYPEIAPNTEVSLLRKKYLSAALSLSYSVPIHMTSSAFQYMYASDGNTYLDAYNNIPHVGHCHPEIAKVASRQLRSLNTNTRYLYDALTEYSEKLLGHFTVDLSKVFYVNSGSEAADLAIRVAQHYTQRKHLLVLKDGYHGNTRMGIDISSYKFDGKSGTGPPSHVTPLPLPKEYRGTQPSGKAYALEAIQIIEELWQDGIQPAAFICEPISGCGGQVPLADGYLQNLCPYLKSKDILYISDEVQVGFGRVGSHFWGYEMFDVQPDMVVLGKPMGNGHPIGGLVTRDDIADAFHNGMEFFSSFGGNPVSMKIASTVLEIIANEGLQNNALITGRYFDNLAKKLAIKYPQIGDVRNRGLFLGLELIDPTSFEPATTYASIIKNKLKYKCILTSTDGPYDNVLKLKPPLCFSNQNVDQFFEAFEVILEKTMI